MEVDSKRSRPFHNDLLPLTAYTWKAICNTLSQEVSLLCRLLCFGRLICRLCGLIYRVVGVRCDDGVCRSDEADRVGLHRTYWLILSENVTY